MLSTNKELQVLRKEDFDAKLGNLFQNFAYLWLKL